MEQRIICSTAAFAMEELASSIYFSMDGMCKAARRIYKVEEAMTIEELEFLGNSIIQFCRSMRNKQNKSK